MNKTICSAAFAFALLTGSGAALAQAVVIEPQQETVIKEYVTKHKGVRTRAVRNRTPPLSTKDS